MGTCSSDSKTEDCVAARAARQPGQHSKGKTMLPPMRLDYQMEKLLSKIVETDAALTTPERMQMDELDQQLLPWTIEQRANAMRIILRYQDKIS